MTTYIVRRLLLMIPTFFGISVVVWLIMAAAPVDRSSRGNSANMEEGAEASAGGTDEARRVFEAQFDLDKPTLLNFYYGIEQADVLAALQGVADLDETRTVKEKVAAQEQLQLWGGYCVPHLLEIVLSTDGTLRDTAMGWLVANAKRVRLVPPGGRVEPEQAFQNAIIGLENATLDRLRWKAGSPPAEKEAGTQGLQEWYAGAASRYPAGANATEVRTALEELDETRLVAWGAGAVAALVEIVRASDGGLRDRAMQWLLRSAAQPVPEGESVEARVAALQNATVEALAWRADDFDSRKRARVRNVELWWEGTASRWDYGDGRWVGVLFTETKFAAYWRKLLRLDLGNSLVHRVPVLSLITSRIKYSLTLALTSLLLAYLVSVPVGILSAVRHGGIGERFGTLILFMLYSLPSFFVATILLRYMAIGTPWRVIPESGFEDINAWRFTTAGRIWDVIKHTAAPIFCMTYASLAALSRYAKTGLLDVIRSDYVRTARAKGLTEFWVIGKHATRNGIIPIITLLGTTLPVLVGGSVIIETIFGIPGFGRLTVESIFNRDYNVIIGIQLIVGVLVMLGILLSDILYAVVDPRISYS